MGDAFNSEYPSIEHLREKARKRMPGFAFDYLESGCNSDINSWLHRPTAPSAVLPARPFALLARQHRRLSSTLELYRG